MKKTLALFASLFILMVSNSYGGDTLSGTEWKATFCGKTTEGENLKSGWTFKIFWAESCDSLTVHYLTGDRKGQTFERPLTVMGSGDVCTKRNGRDRCWKVAAKGDGVYHRIGFSNGKHFVTDKNPIDGKQF